MPDYGTGRVRALKRAVVVQAVHHNDNGIFTAQDTGHNSVGGRNVTMARQTRDVVTFSYYLEFGR